VCQAKKRCRDTRQNRIPTFFLTHRKKFFILASDARNFFGLLPMRGWFPESPNNYYFALRCVDLGVKRAFWYFYRYRIHVWKVVSKLLEAKGGRCVP
jgi:hypothetical protein